MRFSPLSSSSLNSIAKLLSSLTWKNSLDKPTNLVKSNFPPTVCEHCWAEHSWRKTCSLGYRSPFNFMAASFKWAFVVPNYGALFLGLLSHLTVFTTSLSSDPWCSPPHPCSQQWGGDLQALLPLHLSTLVEASLSIHALGPTPLPPQGQASIDTPFSSLHLCLFILYHSSHHTNMLLRL